MVSAHNYRVQYLCYSNEPIIPSIVTERVLAWESDVHFGRKLPKEWSII